MERVYACSFLCLAFLIRLAGAGKERLTSLNSQLSTPQHRTVHFGRSSLESSTDTAGRRRRYFGKKRRVQWDE
eukprot:scaffold286433_cov19-Prasinocladus_malaysianus.AAC.1